jgi:hypothetical protein
VVALAPHWKFLLFQKYENPPSTQIHFRPVSAVTLTLEQHTLTKAIYKRRKLPGKGKKLKML